MNEGTNELRNELQKLNEWMNEWINESINQSSNATTDKCAISPFSSAINSIPWPRWQSLLLNEEHLLGLPILGVTAALLSLSDTRKSFRHELFGLGTPRYLSSLRQAVEGGHSWGIKLKNRLCNCGTECYFRYPVVFLDFCVSVKGSLKTNKTADIHVQCSLGHSKLWPVSTCM